MCVILVSGAHARVLALAASHEKQMSSRMTVELF